MHQLRRVVWNWCSGARSGAVAVEFALIAPILILIFFATVELAQLLDCRTRVIDGTASAADLIAQGSSINDSGLSAMVSAIKAIIYPYSTTDGLNVVITGISCTAYDGGCTAEGVDWSYASGTSATLRTSVPTDLSSSVFTEAGAGVVMVEVTYAYTSPTTELLGGDLSLHWTAYSVPREITAVSYTSE